jgi:hypothetical protein
MALVLFESRVNMITAATPSVGGYVVAYDILDGVLKQKNDQGIITPIGSTAVGSLTQTLAIGNTSGTYSINLGLGTKIGTIIGSASLKLDNGSSGNYVHLSTAGSTSLESNLVLGTNSIRLIANPVDVYASDFMMGTSSFYITHGSNQFFIQNNNSYLRLGSSNVLEFTTATSSRSTGSRVPAFISSNASSFSNSVSNSVIIGGSNIVGTQSNSVYVPNIIIKDGGYVKGTKGSSQLFFTSLNEAYIKSDNRIIGFLSSTSSLATSLSSTDLLGLIIGDTTEEFLLPRSSNDITFLSAHAAKGATGISNTVVIGGDGINATQSGTTYLGGTIDINNEYRLPTTDGSFGQVIKTDGDGNLIWGDGVTTPVITVTAATFSLLGTFSVGSTYKIIDADTDLYGGTEVYLTTNSQGLLNEYGIGKFYNPLYNQAASGFTIWDQDTVYATSSVVIWGGRAWRNISGTNSNPSVDIFNLDLSQWTLIAYNNTNYKISYDLIKYDRVNDIITYRSEKNSNTVSTNFASVSYFTNNGLYNPIKSFQWGNLYSYTTGKGIGNQFVENSYTENINFKGNNQTGIDLVTNLVSVITTTASITTNTLDNMGNGQTGKCVIIDNGTYSINFTVDSFSGFTSTYLKHGTASISFVQGSGRTLIQVDGTLDLDGSKGSTATLISYDTTDYLRISNV